jgi:hypothetical protein
MRLRVGARFDKEPRAINATQRDRVERALCRFVADTRHPSLEFEELRGHDPAAFDRFNRGDRMILRATAEPNPFALDRLGPHGPYDRIR